MYTNSPGTRSSGHINAILVTPILACVYSLIISPLLLFIYVPSMVRGTMEVSGENKLVWPALAVISIIVAKRDLSRRARVIWPPHILCLLACLAFAGLSSLWAFSPETAFIRSAQQAMIITSIALPAIVTVRQPDMTHGLFICFAAASSINVFFVIAGFQTFIDKVAISFTFTHKVAIGYSGYFMGKNYLGECAAITLLLALYELFYPGRRRYIGIIVIAISISLIFFSNSKTALGLALLSPILAGFLLATSRCMRVSPAVIVFTLLVIYIVFAKISGFTMNRVSYMLYGDSSFSGRQVIWDYVNNEIAHRPLLGWGFRSFWLVGPSGPSILNAPGWVKTMPNSHNGYYEMMLDTGYIGFALLVLFIMTMLHGIGHVANRDPVRAWTVLSVVLLVIMHNSMESTWFRGFEFMWIVFLILAVDIAPYCCPLHFPGRVIPRKKQVIMVKAL